MNLHLLNFFYNWWYILQKHFVITVNFFIINIWSKKIITFRYRIFIFPFVPIARNSFSFIDALLRPDYYHESDGKVLRKSLERIPSPPYQALRTTASGLDDLYEGWPRAQRESYPIHVSTIVFRKRTKVRRKNAHLHALATWRARNVTCADLNAAAYFEEESLLDHETWELSHPLPYRTRLSTNKLTFITHTSRFTRTHYARAPISSLLHIYETWNKLRYVKA